jgi:hypothetical protein
MKVTCCCGAYIESAPDLFLAREFIAAHAECVAKRNNPMIYIPTEGSKEPKILRSFPVPDISSLIRFSAQGAWGPTRDPVGELVYFEDVQKLLGDLECLNH